MSVETTAVFSLDTEMLIDFCFRVAGGQQITAYELRSAKQAAELLQVELEEEGLLMWRVQHVTLPLTAGVNSITFGEDVDEVLEMTLYQESSNSYVPITRIGRANYENIPYKDQQGRPINVFVQRGLQAGSNVGNVTGTLWPVPDSNDTYSLSAWVLTFMRDVGDFQSNPDIPRRYITPYAWGLAWYIAMSRPQIGADRLQLLKTTYKEALARAQKRDADKNSWQLAMNMGCYNRW